MKNKLRLDEKNMESLVQMLNSDNEADKTVALSIMENCDIEKSIIVICLVFKQCKIGISRINALSKKLHKHITKYKFISDSMIYSEIYKISKHLDYRDMDLILNSIKAHMINIVGMFNHNMMEELNIQITLKNNG